LLGWADIIYCMEKKHYQRIKEKYQDIIKNKKVLTLHITDDYPYMDEHLIELLKCYVDKYFKEEK